MKLSEERIKSISQIGRDFSDATIFLHEAIAAKAGLSGADHKYLGLLLKHGAMTAGEMAKYTGLTTGAVTGLVDRLENKGLVKRVFNSGDRRKVIIEPDKEAAERLITPLFADIQGRIIELISKQTEAELEAVKKYMLAAIELMKDAVQEIKNKN